MDERSQEKLRGRADEREQAGSGGGCGGKVARSGGTERQRGLGDTTQAPNGKVVSEPSSEFVGKLKINDNTSFVTHRAAHAFSMLVCMYIQLVYTSVGLWGESTGEREGEEEQEHLWRGVDGAHLFCVCERERQRDRYRHGNG